MAKQTAQEKFERLTGALKASGPLLVAFSGGVDSTFLLEASRLALGNGVIAATARGPLFPKRELDRASGFCRDRGIAHVVLQFDPTGLDAFRENSPDRCYVCKRAMSTLFRKAAGERGVNRIAHGANLDDLDDYRPGLQAARETGLEAPLMDARLAKDEIRRLSRGMGLAAWDLPGRACLASRIPYGERITKSALERVDLAERFFEEAGFLNVRVRHHNRLARVEIPPGDIPRILEQGLRKAVIARLKDIGFLHVALDLEGYVTGSLNRGIPSDDMKRKDS
ncbi:MAG: ATP-dependent sacrificial sulfur transferase LarE [Thermodesulfobacteriota bacterium]